jgi:large subunit ribosomal protein L10
MAKVELKQPIVQQIADEVKDSAAVLLVDYRGLTVAQDTNLRKQLREAGILYKVYKNTMMKRAFEGTGFSALDSYLEGPSALAVSKDDATAPARILSKFAKDAKALELKAGFVEGKVYEAKDLLTLAQIPSREELLSKLLGSIQSPIANFARVIKQFAENGGEPTEEAKAAKAAKLAAAPAQEVKEEVKEVAAVAEEKAEAVKEEVKEVAAVVEEKAEAAKEEVKEVAAVAEEKAEAVKEEVEEVKKPARKTKAKAVAEEAAPSEAVSEEKSAKAPAKRAAKPKAKAQETQVKEEAKTEEKTDEAKAE